MTDTEENLPGQMTFGMEESESGLEKFSDEETKAEDPVQTEEISVDEEITAETDADGFRAVEETDEVPFDEDDEISLMQKKRKKHQKTKRKKKKHPNQRIHRRTKRYRMRMSRNRQKRQHRTLTRKMQKTSRYR